MTIFGTDVSQFQNPAKTDYAQLRKGGVQFASVRACDGFVRDTCHDAHHAGFRAQDIVTQSYCFAHPSMDAVQLADFFTARAFFDQMKPCVDMESLHDGHVPDNAGEWCLLFCERLAQNTGTSPIVYASTSYANVMARQCPTLTRFHLWAAEYRSPPNPNEIIKAPGWTVVAVQYAGNVPLAGIPGLADRDVVFADSLDALLVSPANDAA